MPSIPYVVIFVIKQMNQFKASEQFILKFTNVLLAIFTISVCSWLYYVMGLKLNVWHIIIWILSCFAIISIISKNLITNLFVFFILFFNLWVGMSQLNPLKLIPESYVSILKGKIVSTTDPRPYFYSERLEQDIKSVTLYDFIIRPDLVNTLLITRNTTYNRLSPQHKNQLRIKHMWPTWKGKIKIKHLVKATRLGSIIPLTDTIYILEN
jgi:hypothetical protein